MIMKIVIYTILEFELINSVSNNYLFHCGIPYFELYINLIYYENNYSKKNNNTLLLGHVAW